MQKHTLSILVVTLVLVLAFTFAFCLSACNKSSTPPPPPSKPTVSTPAPTPDPKAPIITKAIYDSLRTGLTYDQATDIIGTQETESRSDYDPGKPGFTGPTLTAWFTWKNPDGSFASLGFINSKLTEKNQENLK